MSFDQRDVILFLATGAAGYLVKELWKNVFPGTPTVTEQLEVLCKLVETCGRAGEQTLRVRISTDAKVVWQMPKCVKDAEFISEHPTTIHLEIIFRTSRKTSPKTTEVA